MKKEILVMDCEERGTFWLTLRSDYRILFATTGEEGLQMLSENVSLVFLNMRLPDMKSMEVFRLIRKKYPSIAVIIITSCKAEEAGVAPFGKGAGDYASRPPEAEDILQKIKVLVGVNNDSRERQAVPLPAENGQDDDSYPDIPPHVVKGIVKVRDFVDQNCSESLTLTAACRMASLSKTYFCYFFKRITGHSLRSYHHTVKSRMAVHLLRDKRLSVKEVALKLGYHDPNYFSTIYKRTTGISPRRQQANGRGPDRVFDKREEKLGKI